MTGELGPGRELPARLIPEVAWSFSGGAPLAEQDTFEARVAAYQERVGASGNWRPFEVAIGVPRIRVRYFGVDHEEPDEYADYEVELPSASGESFTNGELLFKLHNAVVGSLRDAEHCYFEGLELNEPGAGDRPPLYEMRQGS